jgi:hypothetical protein
MPTSIELLDTYEIANRIVDESAVFSERGELALVSKARELTRAKSAWDDLRKMPVNDLGSPERAKAFAACDAFAAEYDSYRQRCLEQATSQAS